MKTFYQKVNLRSKKLMIGFLSSHFRYNTMNSWNCSTSYANNVKIHRLDLPKDVMDKAWEMLDSEEFFDDINLLFNDFALEHDYNWQVGFNGRSSGYIVLYQGGKNYDNAHTARCTSCFKYTYHKQDTPCTTKGCNGTLKVLVSPKPQIVTYPGKSVDQETDFEDWDVDSLRERVKLIQEFDRLCDDAVSTFVDFCKNYEIVEEEINVTKKIKVLQSISA